MIKPIAKILLSVLLALFLSSCSTNEEHSNSSVSGPDDTLFKLLPAEKTNIEFSNDLSFNPEFNIYRYRNFYNGGGVALGDINNDGLMDIYFTSNMEENKLYLNEGNMRFRDITSISGVAGRRKWSTGVSMADVNGDGLVDIYVANSGILENDDRKNELFINNGDSTFTEKAEEYGIADPGLSIHGSFFDYDRDGDLDLYLLNNSYRAIGSFNLEDNTRDQPNDMGGDKLYENTGNQFVEVTEKAGIYNSEIGFGLGVSVADLNRDGWPDIYISNDFFERDYLYINNQDGTFREVLEEQMNSISAASMGADIADLNGDGYPEIFVTDMLPEPESRLKKVTTFDDWEGYRNYVRNGYFHQFTRNMLQLNNGNGTFSEVGRWAGVEATDWSWGANIADFDLDGRRDIFVSNGIYQDITNLDYLKEISRGDMVRRIVQKQNVDFKRLIDMMPSTPISNYAFRNLGRVQFADSAQSWGLDKPGFSNGSAYGDLDNDGDLELVVNNLSSNASIYENRATQKHPDRHWLKVDLQGTEGNTNAVGAQLDLWANGQKWYAEQMPIRGFQSTMDSKIHFGLGEITRLDSLTISWPGGRITRYKDIPVDTLLSYSVEKNDGSKNPSATIGESRQESPPALLQDVTENLDIGWHHQENSFVDFNRDKLLYHMRSTEGPAVCTGDANGDGLEDFYVGGAKGQPGTIFLQEKNGTLTMTQNATISADKESEDTACTWFDADGDNDQDLYVASGSNEFPASSAALGDRLYVNEGSGDFTKSDQPLPSWQYHPTSTVEAADYDNDGDLDLFVGVRLRPFAVGTKVRGYLLKNNGKGEFEDVTEKEAPGLMETGMITDAQWGDVTGDGTPDLLVSGEWMPLRLFEYRGGAFQEISTSAGIDSTNGWWHAVKLHDLDGDGDLDFIAGNHGLNSRFEASKDKPAQLWTNDFDGNGTIEQLVTTYKQDQAYPLALRHNLIEQIPSLESKYPDYKSFAGEGIRDIFSDNKLKESTQLEIYQLASVVGWNDGEGNFSIEELPMRAQLSPMYGILTEDVNQDGSTEVLMGGNLYSVKPEVGRYDASYGLAMTVLGDSLRTLTSLESGFMVEGEIRNIVRLDRGRNTDPLIIVGRNDAGLKFFEVKPDN